MTDPALGSVPWFEVATGDPGPGAPAVGDLRDPSGNQFGVFTPLAA
jgi:hypothetical protein